jgi:hypothetical protein
MAMANKEAAYLRRMADLSQEPPHLPVAGDRASDSCAKSLIQYQG